MITVLRVDEVDVSSQADLAGIQVGDYLIDYNGVALYRTEQLAKLCASTTHLVNSMEILRGDQSLICSLSPGSLGITIVVSQISDRTYRLAKAPPSQPEHIPSAVATARQQLQQVRRVLMATLDHIPQHRISEVYEPVSYTGLCNPTEVLPLGASLIDMLSSNHLAAIANPHAYQQLQQLCCERLQAHAWQLGANAVLNLRFDFSMPKSDNGTILLMATGMAVRVEVA